MRERGWWWWNENVMSDEVLYYEIMIMFNDKESIPCGNLFNC